MSAKQAGSTRGSSETTDRDGAVLFELRRMNRLLAFFTTRGIERSQAIPFLDAAGYSSIEIGEILGVNPVTVRTTLHRGRRASGNDATVDRDSQDASSQGEGPASGRI